MNKEETRGRKKVSCESLPLNIPFRRSDVARILGCSLPSVDRMVGDNLLKLKVIKGKKFLIREDD